MNRQARGALSLLRSRVASCRSRSVGVGDKFQPCRHMLRVVSNIYLVGVGGRGRLGGGYGGGPNVEAGIVMGGDSVSTRLRVVIWWCVRLVVNVINVRSCSRKGQLCKRSRDGLICGGSRGGSGTARLLICLRPGNFSPSHASP